MGLPVSVDGILQTTLAAPDANSRFEAGLSYAAGGNLLHVTQVVSPTDSIIGAIRRSASGQMVVGPGDIAARPYNLNAGFPSDKRPGRVGVVIAQRGVPLATDPRISGGIAVGPLGGCYVTAM